jgi:hypothetical protein
MVSSQTLGFNYRLSQSGAISSIRVKDRFVVVLINTSANQIAQYYGISLATTTAPTGPTAMLLNFIKLSNMKGIYRHYGINSFKLTYMPSLNDTATGNVCIGWEPDPAFYGNATTYTPYLGKDVHIMTHVLKPATMVWRPTERKEKEERHTNDPVATRTAEEMSFGILQMYSSNNQPISTQIGLMLVEVDITFSNPNT